MFYEFPAADGKYDCKELRNYCNSTWFNDQAQP